MFWWKLFLLKQQRNYPNKRLFQSFGFVYYTSLQKIIPPSFIPASHGCNNLIRNPEIKDNIKCVWPIGCCFLFSFSIVSDWIASVFMDASSLDLNSENRLPAPAALLKALAAAKMIFHIMLNHKTILIRIHLLKSYL